MRVAIVGSGGREHALAWKLEQSPEVAEVVVLPGNGGTPCRAPVDAGDVEGIRTWCVEHGADLVVVGPEAILAAGLVDALEAAGVRAFGPCRQATRLESSKVWAKELMARHGVSTAPFEVFETVEEAQSLLAARGHDAVLKYDGLAAGKGVFVCRDAGEAERALEALAARWGPDARGLVEDRLEGRELSVIGVTDGRDIRLLAPSQDHKQLLDGDRGPNTGGMGAFAPVPFADEALLGAIRRRVVEPTLEGLRAERIPYRGFLYFGLMVTADGPQVLEYNARMGDPEAEVVLPALNSDLLPLLVACLDGRLAEEVPEVSGDAFVDVVLASGGYPGAYDRGLPITGLDRLARETLVFHAGTERRDGRLVTAGGRVLNVVARAETLDAAIAKAYEECNKVVFKGATFRRDIGRREGGP